MITKAENQITGGYNNGSFSSTEKNNSINTNLQRVRKLSNATEKLSKTMLNGVGVVSGSVMVPVMKSKPDKILDAAEAAEGQTLSATSRAATRMVSERYGENAEEATEDVLATAGHAAGTAWNVLKIRKSFYPSSSLKSGIIQNAPKE